MDRHCSNAMSLAEHLETIKDVIHVKYPHLKSHPNYELAKKQMKLGGGVVTFELMGGIERGRKFLNSLEMFSHTANLGDSRTIATHPASTTHSKLSELERKAVGITDGLIRISVGLEHIEDIKKEIDHAILTSKL
jgi:O-succinylhomoserine sulfhydrylase